MGQASQHSGLNCHLLGKQSLWVSVQALVVALLILLSTNTPGKATNDGPRACAIATHVEDQKKLLAPVFSLAHLWPLELLVSLRVEGV